jgi:tetratricopeptide (TPR) repeat protein
MNYTNPITPNRCLASPSASLSVSREPKAGWILCSVLCAVLLFATSSGLSMAAPADDFKEASRLYQQGRMDQAMAKVNAGLQGAPKDAQGRFLKGLILTEQKKITEAIQVFTSITEDFPELPEPYNNLAVLYAGQGNYDKAKAALELAIHTNPAYGTAHENLGDIYAQLARRAYDKALQLDKANTTAQSKLAMVKEIFTQPKSTPAAASPTQTAQTARVDNTRPGAGEPAKPAASAATAAAVGASKAAPTSAATEDGVKATVQAWAKAWSARDVPAYLGFYAADFQTPDGLARGAWEAQRKERIERQSKISVEVAFRSVKIKGNEATAVFRQAYRADTVNSNNTKTLKLVRAGDKWLIQIERSGG